MGGVGTAHHGASWAAFWGNPGAGRKLRQIRKLGARVDAEDAQKLAGISAGSQDHITEAWKVRASVRKRFGHQHPEIQRAAASEPRARLLVGSARRPKRCLHGRKTKLKHDDLRVANRRCDRRHQITPHPAHKGTINSQRRYAVLMRLVDRSIMNCYELTPATLNAARLQGEHHLRCLPITP